MRVKEDSNTLNDAVVLHPGLHNACSARLLISELIRPKSRIQPQSIQSLKGEVLAGEVLADENADCPKAPTY